MKNRYLLIIICVFLICNCTQKVGRSKNISYVRNYVSLIDEYNDNSFQDENSAKVLFSKIISTPEHNFLLKFNYSIVKKFMTGTPDGLPKAIFIDSPKILDYAKLGYVFKNGDIWFSSVRKSFSSLFKPMSNEIIRNESINKLYEYNKKRKIYFEKELYNLEYDKKNNEYFIENNDVRIFKSHFPLYFQSGFIISPIISENVIWVSSFSLKFNNNINARDYMLMVYNWQKDKVEKEIILPSISKYKLFTLGVSEKDSKERIYLRIAANFRQNYPGMTEGHIMIYDIFKDTMYNIYHPLMDNVDEGEELLETQYILGEDENIYYQLVTSKAYYIYKIEPLWNKPMEEIEYKTMFFDYYPELKVEWERLQNESVKE